MISRIWNSRINSWLLTKYSFILSYLHVFPRIKPQGNPHLFLNVTFENVTFQFRHFFPYVRYPILTFVTITQATDTLNCCVYEISSPRQNKIPRYRY